MDFILDDDQLDAFRAIANSSYPDSAIIYQPVKVSGDRGQTKSTFAIAVDADDLPLDDVACRPEMIFNPPQQIVAGNQLQTQTNYDIFFPFFVMLEPGWRIQIDGVNYQVIDSNSHAERQVDTIAKCLRIT